MSSTTTTTTSSKPRKLTAAQQVRLTQYLDDELLNVERDVNKRTDPSSPIPSLPTLITRLLPILNLIMSIPSTSPTCYIRVQYLLRFTSGLREQLSGYSITGVGVVEHGKRGLGRGRTSKATAEGSMRVLDGLLRFIERLDLAWRVVLSGAEWDDGSMRTQRRDRSQDVERISRDSVERGSINPVSMTDKIRLRSSILALRERILSWAEKQSYLLSSKPPNREETSETDLSALEDEVDKGVRVDEGEEDVDGAGMGWKGRVMNSMRGTLNELDL